MASLTFNAGTYKITVRTRRVERPTGLARVGWMGHNDYNVTVRISPDELHLNIGSILYDHETEKYWFSIGSVDGRWRHRNDAKYKLYHTTTVEVCLAFIAAYIKGAAQSWPTT